MRFADKQRRVEITVHLAHPPSRYVSNRLRMFIDWTAELFARLA